jgi:putative transcriptional regulator
MRGSVGILLSLTAALSLAPPALAQAEAARTFLLVAQPDMLDPNFSRTVVLVMRPEDGGPLGIILNRPTNVQLRELYPERAELTGRDDLVFIGGPVQPDALLFAFRSPAKPAKGLNVTGDIYISGFSEVLDELLKHPENASEQRFFAGYAGWAQGQLEFEIARGGWYTLPLDVDAIFRMNPLTLYDELVKRAAVRRIETRREIPDMTSAASGRH